MQETRWASSKIAIILDIIGMLWANRTRHRTETKFGIELKLGQSVSV